MVSVKKISLFSTFLFIWYMPGKCVLRYSRTKKRLSRLKKPRSSKSRKIEIFLKRLTHGFDWKIAIFPTFIFRQYRPEKCVLRYSRTKKRLSSLKQQHVQKVEKLRYFQRSWPMVLVQKWPFFQRFLFWPYMPGKCVSRYFRTKKRLSRL